MMRLIQHMLPMRLSLIRHVIIIYAQQDIIILAQDYTINEGSKGHPRNVV